MNRIFLNSKNSFVFANLLLLALFLACLSRTGHAQDAVKNADISRAAPDKCLFYTEWKPAAKPTDGQLSKTEKLLQENEVKIFLDDIHKTIVELVPRAVGDGDREVQAKVQLLINKFLESANSKSGAVFVETVGLDLVSQKYRIEGAILMEMEGDKSEIRNAFKVLMKKGEIEFEETKINDVDFVEFAFHEDSGISSKILFGGNKNYFIVGAGRSSVRKCLKRLASGETPEWVKGVRERQKVPRPFGLTFVNLKLIVDQYLPLAGDEVMDIAKQLGVDSIGNIESVSGYDNQGMVSRTSLQLTGPATGLLKMLDGRPVNPKMIKQIPADSFVAGAAAIDAKAILGTIREMIAGFGPSAQREFDYSMKMFEVDYGFSLEDDLLAHIGPTVVVANGAGDGWFTGMTMRVEITNRSAVASSLSKLLLMMQRAAAQWGMDIHIEQEAYMGQTIYYVRVKNGPFPLEPAWCFFDDQIVFSMMKNTLRPLIENRSSDEELKLGDLLVEQGLASRKLLATMYVDDRRQFEFLYPYLLVLKTMIPQMMSELNQNDDAAMDFASRFASLPFPSARSIYRHLQPSLVNIYRTETGLDMVVRQTIPSPNIAVTSPIAVALLLPAVQAARMAARRTQSANNLKMMMLANHNYHDTMKRFPAGYSVDKNGRPLLSWRVHLLPYMEQANLYEQFHLDEPWDSEHNRKLIKRMPEFFRAPQSLADEGKTTYRGMGGFHGMFRVPSRPGNSGNRIASTLDGTSNTIMIMETTDELAIEWTKPEVLEPGNFDISKLFGTYPGGTNAAFVDGSIHFISDAITPRQIALLFNRHDGESFDWSRLVEAQEIERNVDPMSFELRYQKEAKDLMEEYKITGGIQTTQLELGVITAKMEEYRYSLAVLRKEIEVAKRSIAVSEREYKSNPSDKLEKEIKNMKTALEAITSKRSEMEAMMQSLETKSSTLGRQLRAAYDKTRGR